MTMPKSVEEFHGCFTGDCPHEQAVDCLRAVYELGKQEADAELVEALKIAISCIDRLLPRFTPKYGCQERPIIIATLRKYEKRTKE